MKSTLGIFGSYSFSAISYLGGAWKLFCSAFFWMLIAPFTGRKGIRLHATFEQMVRIGVNSLPIVGLVLFFVGMILALQMAYVLSKLNSLAYIANITAVAMTRELGPMLTAVVMSGRVGASIAAELGTMKVSEEILALETGALNPVRFLVVPRLLAAMVMFPCLTIASDYIGIFGGYLVSVLALGVDSHVYYSYTVEALKAMDVLTGLIKAEAFAIVVTLIACYEGFRVAGGAEGVGKSTTSSVVLSIICIIGVDCLFTSLMYAFGV